MDSDIGEANIYFPSASSPLNIGPSYRFSEFQNKGRGLILVTYRSGV